MKRNAGGLWFSTKRKERTRSEIVRDLGSTLLKKGEIRERLLDSSLRDDSVATGILGTLGKKQ